MSGIECPFGVRWPPQSSIGRAGAVLLVCVFARRNDEQMRRPAKPRMARLVAAMTRAAWPIETERLGPRVGGPCCAREKGRTVPTALRVQHEWMTQIALEWRWRKQLPLEHWQMTRTQTSS